MTKKLTTTGVLLALGLILSLIKLFDAPYGGSVTLASMLPVILIAVLYGPKWGVLSGLVFAVLTMLLTGIPAPPVPDMLSYFLVIILDYILAFGGLGLAGGIYRKIPGKAALPVSAAVVVFLRFICHFLSGILIWRVYAWEGCGAAMYSFLYNGSYMLFEFLITVLLSVPLAPMLTRQK